MRLREASLSDMARELRRRARRTCRRCGGYGHVGPLESCTSSAVATTCPRCQGTGYEEWPELRDLAGRLEWLAGGGGCTPGS